MDSENQSESLIGDVSIESVSVIIPAYNAARTLRVAVDSCLKQSIPPLEIIIIDDGSADQTFELATSLSGPIRVLRQKNAGPGAARNAGARIALGKWLAFLDADDWWMPNKLERQLALAADPSVDIVHTRTNRSHSHIPPLLTFDDLWQRNWISNSSSMIRKSLFLSLGGFDEHPDMFVCEDYNLWLRAAASGAQIVLCDDLLTYYAPDIGVSANAARFLKGAERNLLLISAREGISASRMEAKFVETFVHVGRIAVHQRDLVAARRLLVHAFRRRPSLKTGFMAIASLLPPSVLDLQRRHIQVSKTFFGAESGPEPEFVRPAPAAVDTPGGRPAVLVVIHGQDEGVPGSPSTGATEQDRMPYSVAAQRIFEKHGVVPTYAIHPAMNAGAIASNGLREWLASGRCEIGGQFHLADAASGSSDGRGVPVPPYIECTEIERVTRVIEDRFGTQPVLFHSGSSVSSDYTGRILGYYGYKIACTRLPRLPQGQDPRTRNDARSTDAHWYDPEERLLRIPPTPITGAMAQDDFASGFGRRKSDKAIWTNLTSEQRKLPGLQKLSIDLVRHQGRRTLAFSCDTSQLRVGGSPDIRTKADLDRFLAHIDDFLGFLLGELNVIPATPSQIHAWAKLPALSGGKD